MIYWNGCSFVVGSEVKERPRDTFAGLVGTHFMTPWWQNAKVGGSNDRIWRTTMDDMIRQPADLVIIVWSGLNRFEYLNEKAQKNLFQQLQMFQSLEKRYDHLTS